jgi:lysozyme family protein
MIRVILEVIAIIVITIIICLGIVEIKNRWLPDSQAHAGGSILPISMNRWEKAFANVLKEEGVYSNNPSDPGGETKWGISKTSYPHIDIKALTKEQAQDIYKKDFWEPIKGDELHDDALAIEVMEEAVNMGSVVAIKFLQAAVLAAGGKIELDGKMGNKTIKEVKKYDPKILLACIKAQSMSYYMSLVHQHPALRKFLKGWFNRVLN